MWKKVEDKKMLIICVKNYAKKKQGKYIHNPYNWFVDKVYEKYKVIDETKTKNSLAG